MRINEELQELILVFVCHTLHMHIQTSQCFKTTNPVVTTYLKDLPVTVYYLPSPLAMHFKAHPLFNF